MDHRCAECAGRTSSLGNREVKYRDLGPDGVGIGVVAVTKRRSCVRCGSASVVGAPDLVSGFRMTHALFDAVGSQATTASFVSVGRRHGIDRATVRNVWNAWRKEMAPEPSHVPAVDVFDVEAGDRTVVVARDAQTSRILGIHSDASSPDLARRLREASPAVVVAGMSHVPFVSEVLPSARVVLDPSSVHGWFARQVEKAARLTSSSLSLEAVRILCKAFVERTPEEDGRLAQLVRGGGEAASVVVELDRLRSAFEKGGKAFPEVRACLSKRTARHLAACRQALDLVAPALDAGGRIADALVVGRKTKLDRRIQGEGLDRFAERTRISEEVRPTETAAAPGGFFWVDGEVVPEMEVEGFWVGVASVPDPYVPEERYFPPPLRPPSPGR